MVFNDALVVNIPPLTQFLIQWRETGICVAAKRDAIVKKYQRRTQKGMGRTEKTVHNGAAKNPRLFKACNITR
jgi:hypothetical protein